MSAPSVDALQPWPDTVQWRPVSRKLITVELIGLAVWQARMQKTGSHLTVDGFYGPQTAGVARSLQVRRHLTVDGLIGPKTWRAAWA